ncbi:hypothetical protein LZ554_002047 [Drepanopeziza brunnea f. sp. 'monogermtubi']|nr:hypothetical protein LZ554_002047 [Drepanopeziza brunnea f. sp. 'monogermtubi']
MLFPTKSHLKRKSKAVDKSMTPPIAFRPPMFFSSSFSGDEDEDDEDDGYDEAYFSKTYVPLSSLPTPPPSCHSHASSRQQSPDLHFCAGEMLDPRLLGPACHLTNLIPPSTSLLNPSVPLVHAILTRAALPLETLALAVCILDSLTSRFALSWRKSLPLTVHHLPPAFGTTNSLVPIAEQHTDAVQPEIIVLCALILAVKFLDDEQQRTKEYASLWGSNAWTCDQVNYTQRVILENLGYRLLPLWEQGIIAEAVRDMERAGRQYRESTGHFRHGDEGQESCPGTRSAAHAC